MRKRLRGGERYHGRILVDRAEIDIDGVYISIPAGCCPDPCLFFSSPRSLHNTSNASYAQRLLEAKQKFAAEERTSCASSRSHRSTPRSSQHIYEVRPRKDHRNVDLISDALPFSRLWYGEADAIGCTKFYGRSQEALIRVYDETGNVVETHESAGESRE